jgi:hypothetical protein
VKANEFKPGSDHVTQVMKVQSTIVGKKPVSNFYLKLQMSYCVAAQMHKSTLINVCINVCIGPCA